MRYVFVGPDIDFIKLQYSDFDTADKGLVLLGKSRHFFKLLSLLRLTQYKFTNIIAVPNLKRRFCRIPVGEKYCFIIYSRVYESYTFSIIRFLRKQYSGCRIVVYYGDLISTHKFDVWKVKEEVDQVFTFDERDAEKYNIPWLLEPFSTSIVNLDEFSKHNNPVVWDVTFVGQAKNRYEKIIRLYEKLVQAGLKCDFHITGVPKNQRKYKKDIGYKPLKFKELLKHVVSSRCVAEVLQNDGLSPTTRYTEAMLFGKNLLTDCICFKDEDKRAANVIYYESAVDISDETLISIQENHGFDRSQYISIFSISTMVKSIDEYLGINGNRNQDKISI